MDMTDGWTAGDPDLIEQIGDHITRHVGPIAQVWHEIVSDDLHIDVHQVDAAPERPFAALITSGMSAAPMTVPPACANFSRAEMAVLLPPLWPLTKKALADERNYWPIRLLKMLARYPHHAQTWLGYGHTVANEGSPPARFARNTRQNAVIVLPSVSLSDDAAVLDVGLEAPIRFWVAVPLYWEELQLKLERGSDALLDAFETCGIGDVVDPKRRNVAKRPWGIT